MTRAGGPHARDVRGRLIYTTVYDTPVYEDRNPFRYGDLALDDAFTDREEEVAELVADMRNGQNVVVYAPRRYGKSSLVLRAAEHALGEGILVGYVDLMKTPTKERFAAALAKTIFEDISSPVGELVERATLIFRGLRVTPVMEVDPGSGSLRFSFDALRHRPNRDINDTIERLLELPQEIANERKRSAVLILDEFQEIVKLDKAFPNLLRSVFQTQPEVGHVYLGSKRHIIDKIFDDRNEAFWRAAKRLEIGMIDRRKFATFIKKRFESTDKLIRDEAVTLLLNATGGHPYGTQQLAYATWELVPTGTFARTSDVEAALTKVLRGEHNHFARIWDEATENQRLLMLALAVEPSGLYSAEYHERHGLVSNTHTQRAATTLVKEEIIGRREDGTYSIIEPFFAAWLQREKTASPAMAELRAASERPRNT